MEITAQIILDFSSYLKEQGKKLSTIQSYSRDVRNFANYITRVPMSLLDIDQDFMQGYQKYLSQEAFDKANSIRRGIISLRQFYRYLMEAKIVSYSPLEDYPIPYRIEITPRVLEIEHVEQLMTQAQTSQDPLKGARDSAILALLCFEGVKVTELTALNWNDLLIDKNHRSLHIAGERARTIFLSDGSADILLRYQRVFKQCQHPRLKKWTQSKMFIAFKGKKSLTPSPHISRHGLKFLIYELGELCGLGKLNTEMLRHYATRYLLNAGKSPEEIMDHFGLRRVGNIAKHLKLKS